MRCLLAVLFVALTTAGVRADDAVPQQIRDLYARGDYEGARRLLLEQYSANPEPPLLFALGQVELNLGHYEAAIDFYEKFIATGPTDEQVALAQQAIGAARMQLNATPSKPTVARIVRRTPPREWYTEDTGLVAFGGAAIVLGTGVLLYSGRLGNDVSGNLSTFEQRLELARTTRWTGVGIAAGGAALIGVTILRWRLRPDREVIVTPTSASVVARW
jgi:tetratricopeptide (TPR) repeat protein